MKRHFPGYFQPTRAEFDKLWSVATISPDANVLLNLYRYKVDTRDRFVSLFEKIKSRLWVSNQAASEFLRNRIDVIQSQIDAFDRINEELERSRKELSGRISEFSRHSAIDVKELSSRVGKSLDQAAQELKKLRQAHPDLLANDAILKAVAVILDQRVGDPYGKAELASILKTIEERYAKAIPPGYADKAKTEGRQYGDCLVWLQLLDYAKANNTPVIFITDDSKDDWWLRHKGRILGPRPELIAEMAEVAKVAFYMYSPDSFLELAGKYFQERIDQAAINDVREIQRRKLLDVKPPLVDAEELSHLIERVNRKRVLIGELETSTATLGADIDRLEGALENAEGTLAAEISFALRTKKQDLMALQDRLRQEHFSIRVLRRRLASYGIADPIIHDSKGPSSTPEFPEGPAE